MFSQKCLATMNPIEGYKNKQKTQMKRKFDKTYICMCVSDREP